MTSAPATPARGLRTWSIADAGRRRLSEYDIVTGKFHYHFGRQPAPFDLDPDSAINQWYLRYREGSPLRAPDWEGFRDPARLSYRGYIALQHDREIYAEGVVDHFEAADHDAKLDPAWVAVLARVYMPARFALHVLQMASLYVGQLGPSAAITNASFFQAADELRALQWIAYRARSLSLAHGQHLADGAVTREIWEDDPAWQPARQVLETLLLAYDWGEAFTALNLVVKPALDAFFKGALADLALANGDGLTAQLLRESAVDTARNHAWAAALARHAVAARPENLTVITDWEQKWRPAADSAVSALAQTFSHAPDPASPAAAAAAVASAAAQFRVRWASHAETVPDASPERA